MSTIIGIGAIFIIFLLLMVLISKLWVDKEKEIEHLYDEDEWDDDRDLTSPETPIPKLIKSLDFDGPSTKAQIKAARKESRMVREYIETKELSKKVEVEKSQKS